MKDIGITQKVKVIKKLPETLDECEHIICYDCAWHSIERKGICEYRNFFKKNK